MVGLIVHEWIAQTGGSERVLEQMVAEFPDADVQVLWNDAPERLPRAVYETWLARTPLRHHKALALPFMPATWRRIPDRRDYDWVMSSSHLFAHHARVRGRSDIPRLVYAHTPARYIWDPTLDARGNGLLPRAASAFFRPIDRRRAQEATAIAANSDFTRNRVLRAWVRDAEVIYPPVDTQRIIAGGEWARNLDDRSRELLDTLPDAYLLGASRFIPYKRLELVIEAGVATGLPVVLAGEGPAEDQLRKRAATASVPVHILPRPRDDFLYALYQRATAFVFPAVEDFGIMPVEAMAAGAPVIAPAVGGASESVALTRGGATFTTRTPQDWRSALDRATAVDRSQLPAASQQFSNGHFRDHLRGWVREVIA